MHIALIMGRIEVIGEKHLFNHSEKHKKSQNNEKILRYFKKSENNEKILRLFLHVPKNYHVRLSL